MTFAEIDALVRALLGPYPRAFVSVDGRQYPVRSAEYAGPLRDPAEPAGPNGATGPQVEVDHVDFPCRDGRARLLRTDGKTAG